MEPLQIAQAVAAVIVTAVGATWALRSKLSDIEGAIKGHIALTVEQHKATGEALKGHDARIIKLEGRVPRGRK